MSIRKALFVWGFGWGWFGRFLLQNGDCDGR